MRTIRVTGKGLIKLRPDMTRITITLEGKSPEYSEAVQKSSKDTTKLMDILTAYGFERSDLKTLDFTVNTVYENYKYRDEYRRRLAGYKYEHMMKLEFDSDNDRLGKILYALAGSKLNPDFQISYTVKDPETAKNRLLDSAIADAKEKASVLTRAAEVTLGAIQNIDYSWGQVNFEVQPMDMCFEAGVKNMVSMDSGINLPLEPDDIEASDTVTVIWEITD